MESTHLSSNPSATAFSSKAFARLLNFLVTPILYLLQEIRLPEDSSGEAMLSFQLLVAPESLDL